MASETQGCVATVLTERGAPSGEEEAPSPARTREVYGYVILACSGVPKGVGQESRRACVGSMAHKAVERSVISG